MLTVPADVAILVHVAQLEFPYVHGLWVETELDAKIDTKGAMTDQGKVAVDTS